MKVRLGPDGARPHFSSPERGSMTKIGPHFLPFTVTIGDGRESPKFQTFHCVLKAGNLDENWWAKGAVNAQCGRSEFG